MIAGCAFSIAAAVALAVVAACIVGMFSGHPELMFAGCLLMPGAWFVLGWRWARWR